MADHSQSWGPGAHAQPVSAQLVGECAFQAPQLAGASSALLISSRQLTMPLPLSRARLWVGFGGGRISEIFSLYILTRMEWPGESGQF